MFNRRQTNQTYKASSRNEFVIVLNQHGFQSLFSNFEKQGVIKQNNFKTQKFNMVALIFLISILQPMNVFGSTLVVKVAKDLVADNLVYINKTTTIFGVFSSKLCSASCDKYATGSVNFRSFEPKNSLCKCFHASKEFRDSRAIAPDLDEGFYLVDGKLISIFEFD